MNDTPKSPPTGARRRNRERRRLSNLSLERISEADPLKLQILWGSGYFTASTGWLIARLLSSYLALHHADQRRAHLRRCSSLHVSQVGHPSGGIYPGHSCSSAYGALRAASRTRNTENPAGHRELGGVAGCTRRSLVVGPQHVAVGQPLQVLTLTLSPGGVAYGSTLWPGLVCTG